MKSKKPIKFNKQFFSDFWQLFKPYWTSDEKWFGILFLGLNIICIIIAIRASVSLNNVNKEFYDALQNLNKAGIFTALLHFCIILTIELLAYGYAFYFNGVLSLRWRRWLTTHFLKKWLNNHNHYRFQLNNNNVDNPDQRISEDLERFPAKSLDIIFMFFNSTLTLASFGYILWNLSGSLSIPVRNFHIIIPGYLFLSAILYGALGTWITILIGKTLAKLNYQKQQANADFRYSLIRLRESSEQISMHKGEAVEKEKFSDFFGKIFTNCLNIITVQKRLTFFTSGYNTAAYMFGIFLAVPLFLQKRIQLGGMMQISGAFGSVISAFALLINGFSVFAEWKSVVSRLAEFNKFLFESNKFQSKILVQEHEESDIVIHNLTLSLPDGSSILNNINLIFHESGRFLISGQSGVGKSTLLRAISKIWSHGDGVIKIPKNKKIYFLPQKPYLPLGSFNEILCYPEQKNIDIDSVNNILKICALEKFQERLNELKNWSQELSLGEQQLVAFARIFLHKPDIVFLDESTSALDEKTESFIYENMRRLLPHATIISVGHRSSLQQFHEKIILLSKDSGGILEEESGVAIGAS